MAYVDVPKDLTNIKTRMVQFYDINYQLAQNDEKQHIFGEYCQFLNYFDESIHFQFCFINQRVDMEEYKEIISIPDQDDAFNVVRKEYADYLRSQLEKGNNGIIKSKYLIFGIEARDKKNAISRLSKIESDILNKFKILGCRCNTINGLERQSCWYIIKKCIILCRLKSCMSESQNESCRLMEIIPKERTKEISKQWFNHGYAQLLMYLNDHVGIDIDKEYVSSDGFFLGEWIGKVRTLWMDNLLSKKQIYQLEQVGLSKREESQDWESIYRYAKNYYMDYSVLPLGRSYRTSDGVILGAWLDRQRRFGFLLSDEQKEKLREIGINVEGE